jgi:hypothetical protein
MIKSIIVFIIGGFLHPARSAVNTDSQCREVTEASHGADPVKVGMCIVSPRIKYTITLKECTYGFERDEVDVDVKIVEGGEKPIQIDCNICGTHEPHPGTLKDSDLVHEKSIMNGMLWTNKDVFQLKEIINTYTIKRR